MPMYNVILTTKTNFVQKVTAREFNQFKRDCEVMFGVFVAVVQLDYVQILVVADKPITKDVETYSINLVKRFRAGKVPTIKGM